MVIWNVKLKNFTESVKSSYSSKKTSVTCIYFKMKPLISSGLAYKLRSGALWCRRHSGVQNDENTARTAPAQSHEPHAGHEGTYHPARVLDPFAHPLYIAPHYNTHLETFLSLNIPLYVRTTSFLLDIISSKTYLLVSSQKNVTGSSRSIENRYEVVDGTLWMAYK